MSQSAALSRPVLTMPPEEAEWLRMAYAQADVILEYGAGGSTVMAGDMRGKQVWSVESDKRFLDTLKSWFKAHPPVSEVNLRHGNIGPTGKWGAPSGDAAWRRFHHYPLDIWSEIAHTPDVVLIDGRFRAGCFLATLFSAQAPVTVYWDDYVEREKYHVVERYATPSEIVGRMARFDITPRPIPAGDLAWIMDIFGRQQ